MPDTDTVLSSPLIPAALAPVMQALCAVGVELAGIIARGPLGQSLGHEVGENAGGDGQKALDFSIFEAKDDADASFLRTASEQVAGGYIIFGPQCCLAVTFGKGTLMFALDPATGQFVLVNDGMQTPGMSKEYAINASNHRHWDAAIRSYIEDCQAGKTGPHGQDSNMRWVASLVAETHRILTRGGIFLYPGDARLVYEVAPIAFLIEQAGGLATDGRTPIMEQAADALHARSPLVFGSPEKVRQVAGYYDKAH